MSKKLDDFMEEKDNQLAAGAVVGAFGGGTMAGMGILPAVGLGGLIATVAPVAGVIGGIYLLAKAVDKATEK